MFVSRVVVSLRVPGLEKKSLVKITSLVHNCRMVEVYTMAKLVRVITRSGHCEPLESRHSVGFLKKPMKAKVVWSKRL